MCPNYGENVQYINTYPVNFTVRKCPCLFGAFKAPQKTRNFGKNPYCKSVELDD